MVTDPLWLLRHMATIISSNDLNGTVSPAAFINSNGHDIQFSFLNTPSAYWIVTLNFPTSYAASSAPLVSCRWMYRLSVPLASIIHGIAAFAAATCHAPPGVNAV